MQTAVKHTQVKVNDIFCNLKNKKSLKCKDLVENNPEIKAVEDKRGNGSNLKTGDI